MSSDSSSGSGDFYAPGNEESDYSDSEYDDDYDSEIEEEYYEPTGLPVIDDDWFYISDPFSDRRPDPVPQFDGDLAGLEVIHIYHTNGRNHINATNETWFRT